MNHKNQKQITIRGIIVPSGWDDFGNVISVSIATFNEDEYLVDKDSASEGIMSCIQKPVEASGFVREEKGIKKIKITKYRTRNMSHTIQ
ncbi:MAG: hypothetical protein SV375_02895 [Thermodesulfobacteriota bacterium]|nr:hypothetical protein [Thermodesulfobacteriota bacterium]